MQLTLRSIRIELFLSALTAVSKILIKVELVGNLDGYVLNQYTYCGTHIHAPSFVGIQFTSWNFFMWRTRSSGKVANLVVLM